MSTPLLNPLCTLEELKLTLKTTETGDDEELRKAINSASRWVEKHVGRLFGFVDASVTALEVDQFDQFVAGDTIYIPSGRILSLDSVTLGTDVLEDGEDYTAKFQDGRIILLAGNWNLKRPTRVLSLLGTFGFRQPQIYPVTVAGDTGGVLSNWTLRNLGTEVVYWGITDLGAGIVQVDLWEDAAHSNRIASGDGEAPGSITLDEDNLSDVSGSVTVASAATDTDAGNTLTPGSPSIDTGEVPEDLPANVNQACRIVAAVFSGHHTKEITGLDGMKQTIKATEVPADVYKMLGRAGPILV